MRATNDGAQNFQMVFSQDCRGIGGRVAISITGKPAVSNLRYTTKESFVDLSFYPDYFFAAFVAILIFYFDRMFSYVETKRNFYCFCVTRFYVCFIYKLFVSRNMFVIYDRVIFLLRLYATHLLL